MSISVRPLCIAATALIVFGATAPQAQEWPTRPVRVIVPFPGGAAADVVPRTVYEQVSKAVGQPFIIENRPGGGGAPAVAAVMGAKPDGHTILAHSNALITTPAIQKMAWDPARDFSGITPLGNVPLVLVVPVKSGIKTLKDFVAQYKAKPGSLNYAAAGIGSPPHLTMERFRLATGIDGQLVPFKGAPEALTQMVAGQIDAYFSPLTPALPLIEAGKLVPLAVSSAKRASSLPDVPTTVEAGFPDSSYEFWIGAVVLKTTPPELVKRIHAATTNALQSPEVQTRFKAMGVEIDAMTPSAFDERIIKESEIAVRLAKETGVGLKK